MIKLVRFSVHLISFRDEELYPNPEKFDPDRFTEDQRKNRHKVAYIPFGEGPRMCLGIKFAYTQIKYALANVVKDFEVQLSPKQKPIKIDPTGIIYQAKDQLFVRMKSRISCNN